MKVKYTDENCDKLASAIVESWDLETCLEFCRDHLYQCYISSESAFVGDLEQTGPDDEKDYAEWIKINGFEVE